MRTKCLASVGVCLLIGAAGVAHADPLGSGFTYQGQLRQAGVPVTGAADMIFTLWEAGVGGAQVGPSLWFDGLLGHPAPVVVVNGLFTTALDFGSVYDGSALWLQIQVRYPSGAGGYTTLNPRQPLTATPYALYALNSPGSELWDTTGTATYNTADTFVGINRSTPVNANEYFGVQAPVNDGYGGMYIRTTGADGLPFYGYAAGVGGQAVWTYLDGTTGDWRVYANGDRLAVTDSGNVGIGTITPDAKLRVTTTTGDAIVANTTAASSYGVQGTGTTAGVRGISGASNGFGVHGSNNTTGGEGVRGSTTAGGAAGVAGYGNFGTGVYGQTADGYGVYGTNGGSNVTGYAGYFNGRVHVNGTLSKSGGAFMIDHPLDPANKFLRHSFVESPDMMNVYNGNVQLDAAGEAVVQLPEWFEALNQEFRYQLTCIGGFAPVYVAEEIRDNQFTIAGGQPGLKVSWQVTGIRHDVYAEANPIVVEEEKPETARGRYLHPELYGQPADAGLYNRALPTAAEGE